MQVYFWQMILLLGLVGSHKWDQVRSQICNFAFFRAESLWGPCSCGKVSSACPPAVRRQHSTSFRPDAFSSTLLQRQEEWTAKRHSRQARLCQAEELNGLDHKMLFCAAPCAWDTLSALPAMICYMRSCKAWWAPATSLTDVSARSKHLHQTSSCSGSDVLKGVSLGLDSSHSGF